jgi:hypothetical protein
VPRDDFEQADAPQATRPQQAPMTAPPYDDRCPHGANTARSDIAHHPVSARSRFAADIVTS